MAIFDKIKQGIDKAGKAAQDVFDEGKLRIDAYRVREQADKAAEALGYAVFRAWESGADLDADARERLVGALRSREAEARKLENDLADAKAAGGAAGGATADGATSAGAAASAESSAPAGDAAGAGPSDAASPAGGDANSAAPGA